MGWGTITSAGPTHEWSVEEQEAEAYVTVMGKGQWTRITRGGGVRDLRSQEVIGPARLPAEAGIIRQAVLDLEDLLFLSRDLQAQQDPQPTVLHIFILF